MVMIYGLVDPRNEQIRYVGFGTANKASQHWSHWLTNGRGNPTLRGWVSDLNAQGLRYRIRCLEENPKSPETALAGWFKKLLGEGHCVMTKASPTVKANARAKYGDRRRMELVKLIEGGMTTATDAQLAQRMNLKPRQIQNYLRDLIRCGIIKSSIKYRGGHGKLYITRTLTVGDSNAVSQSQVGGEVDAVQGRQALDGHSGHPSDVFGLGRGDPGPRRHVGRHRTPGTGNAPNHHQGRSDGLS